MAYSPATTMGSRRRVSRNLLGLLVAILASLLLVPPAGALVTVPEEQPPYWGDTCGSVSNPDRDGFTSHSELGERLEQIAEQSGGAFYPDGTAPHNPPPGHGGTPPGHGGTPPGLGGTPPANANADVLARRVIVDVPGYSVQGREIYRARVGGGDKVALLVGNIHGNEKHGMEALQNILEALGTSESANAKLIRRELTVVAIPMFNPDGATLDRRQNDQPWSLVQEMYPQLEGAGPPWYYSNNAGGFDLNRDFNADFSYEPTPETLPPADGNPGSYLSTESRTMREVYTQLQAEFGNVDVVVDLHNQGPCVRDRTNDNEVSFLSISGWLSSGYPSNIPEGVDADLTRQANVAIYDALQIDGTQWQFVTRYARSLGRPGAMLGAFGSHGSATVLMETSGQTQHIGTQFKDFLVLGNQIALNGLLRAFANGSIHDIDPERYEDIPL